MGSKSEHTTVTSEVPAVEHAERGLHARTPQGVLLSLQQGHGNAAVARFLAGKGQPTIHSDRFEDAAFEEILAGKKTLHEGQRGPTIGKLQQALVDAGHPVKKVDSHFDKSTREALVAFQNEHKLPPTGELDSRTFKALDRLFTKRTPYVEDAQEFDRHDEGGRELSDREKHDVDDALAPGSKGKFKESVGGKHYADRIRLRLDKLIPKLTKKTQPDKPHKEENLHPWKRLERVMVASKQTVDALYGGVVKGGARPPFSHDRGTLVDQWVSGGAEIDTYDPQERVDNAFGFVWYLITANAADISKEHNANPDDAEEYALLFPIAAEFVNSEEKIQTVLDLYRNWPGMALPSEGKVFIQRFKKDSEKDNRAQLWKLFHIGIHEYLHTLADPKWWSYANQRYGNDEARRNTLIEGFCDFFTLNTRKTVNIGPELREQVEGGYYDEKKPVPPNTQGVYPSTERAEQVVAIVGIRNAELAYFRGEVDKVGGALPTDKDEDK